MLQTVKPCSETVRGPCEGGKPERPRYFPRQLITPEEMNLEAAYFRDRMRRHNRLLHGWGVVCGAEVCPVPSPGRNGYGPSDDIDDVTMAPARGSGPSAPHGRTPERPRDDCEPCAGWEPWKMMVAPGYILGPYGDEITIDSRVVVDLRRYCTPGVSGDCWSQAPDPWCSDVKVTGVESPVFVAVRYREMMTRPVRVPPPGCGCDDLDCDYSRWCDGYEICTLRECPDSHKTPPIDQPEHRPDCPSCPDEPWVVLAEVGFDRQTGCVEHIDNCHCRRLVRSHACDWWRCSDPPKHVGGGKRHEHGVRHVGGGYYQVEGFGDRVRGRERAESVARALDEGLDPYEVLD